MKIPVPLQLAVIAVLATGFYTWVGQMVPQKEVHPPEVVEIAKDIGPEEMVEIGKTIFEGKGICNTCHKIGGSGPQRFPDLAGIGARAANQVPGMTGLQYLTQTLYEPDAYIVPGFIAGMPAADKPPVGLTDDEILTVIAYLQSLGGTPTVTMETDLLATNGSTEGAGDEASGEAVAATGEEVAGAGSEVSTPLTAFGCTTCHYTDQPGEKEDGAPSLYDIGARQGRSEIVLGITDHSSEFSDLMQVTVADLQAIVDYLTELKGNG